MYFDFSFDVFSASSSDKDNSDEEMGNSDFDLATVNNKSTDLEKVGIELNDIKLKSTARVIITSDEIAAAQSKLTLTLERNQRSKALTAKKTEKVDTPAIRKSSKKSIISSSPEAIMLNSENSPCGIKARLRKRKNNDSEK